MRGGEAGLGEDRDDRTAASQTRKAPPAPASSTRINFRAGEETRQTGIKHLGTIEGRRQDVRPPVAAACDPVF
jgi:hypothetical protein